MSRACRELCERGGEPLAGSAGQDELHLGIAWPKPLWHAEDAHRSTGLPPELGTVLAEAKAERRGLKLRLFQREPDPPRDAVELVAAGRGLALGIDRVPLARLAGCVREIARGETPAGARMLGSEIFVCTDGKHDRCCAELGFALFGELAEQARRRHSRVRVAESSHLGGHRFAANCLVLPSLWLYGRVTAAVAGRLLDSIEHERVLGEHLRGRLGAPELAQIGDAWLQTEHPGLALDAMRVVEEEGAQARIELRAGSRRFTLRCRAREFAGPTSCGGPDEARRRWVLEGPA